MKKFYLLAICCLLCQTGFSQGFSTTWGTGVPNITGWTYANGTSFVNGTSFELTQNIGNQSGYIYYSTPENLTTCAQFTVDFQFQIIGTPGYNEIADGIAFWYITNPPSGFTSGGAIGLPTNANGYVLIMDTYDNNGPSDDNPLVTMFGWSGNVPQYQEPETVGLLGTNLTNQNFIDDGNWHECKIVYSGGTITVSFPGSTTATITAPYTLNQTGYFGFSASTGAVSSQQSIKDVTITGNAAPPPPTAVSPVTYCQYAAANPLTVTQGTSLIWYTTPGGTPLPGAPTPNTSVPGTTYYYVTQGGTGSCASLPDTIQVIVNAQPAAPVITGNTTYCAGATFVPFTVTGSGILWYTTANGGTGTATAPVVNTNAPGTYTYYASQNVNGCESARGSITVVVYPVPPPPVVTGPSNYCYGDPFVPFTVIYDTTTTQLCHTNSLIINTGYNPITGLAITPGANGAPAITDPHWILSAVAPDVATAIASTPITGLVEVTPGNNADVITTLNGFWTANPAADPGAWISCLNSNAYYDNGSGTATYYMVLGRPFRMCSDDSIKLSFYIANDNYCSAMNIDGVPLAFSQPVGGPSTNFSTYTYFTQTVFLTAGTHTINVEVNNLDTPVPQENQTGLNLYGTVSSVSGSNSLASENSAACDAYVCNSTGQNVLWYDSTGASSTSAPIINTSAPGTYTYHVTQTVNGCESAADTVTVVVNPVTPPPVITATTSYCTGQPFVPFAVQGTNVLWYTTATGGVGNPTAPVINTGVVGVYTFYASQTINGCEGSRASVTVSVGLAVTTGFAATLKYGCAGDTVAFTNTSTGAIYYAWYFGDGYTDTSANPTHIYKSQGTYIVTLFSTNGPCSGAIFADTITISHPLQASFTLTPDTICQGQTITFTNTSIGTQPVYFWNFGDGFGSITTSPTHVFNIAGVYQVRLAENDFIPCFDTAYATVFVDSTSAINFSISDSMLCEGKPIIFTGDYSNIGNIGNVWNFGDGSVVFNSNPIQHAYNAPGVMQVTLTTNYRICRDTSITKTVTINPYPVLNLGPDTSICPNSTPIALHDLINAANPLAKWLWNTGDTSSTILIDKPDTYYTTVTINGCSTSDSVWVKNDCYINLPNAFTPNGDGVNDYFFPRELLTSGATLFSMNIYNRWGQLIFTTTSTEGRGWDGRFNDELQPQGVYVYVIDVTFKNGKQEHHQGNVSLLR